MFTAHPYLFVIAIANKIIFLNFYCCSVLRCIINTRKPMQQPESNSF